MRVLKYVLIAAFAVALFSAVPASHAQVSVGIDVGVAPACPYGYYGYAPYQCAPYGYYGPEWFGNGIFIGAGPWHHGEAFYGHVNRSYDPRFGYHGAFPEHGPGVVHPDNFRSFQGTHYSDHQGNYHTEAEHSHYAGGQHPR